jgi:hypothetical protein
VQQHNAIIALAKYVIRNIGDTIIKRGSVRIPSIGLTPPPVSAYPKPGPVDIGGMFTIAI